MPLKTNELSKIVDVIAPDGSEIRFLGEMTRASMVHCTLPPNRVSKAVCHKTIEEIWYFLSGEGQVWRSFEGKEEVDLVTQGTCLTIPVGAHFQFRNTGITPLHFIISTMPPWPGAQEAELVPDYWQPD